MVWGKDRVVPIFGSGLILPVAAAQICTWRDCGLAERLYILVYASNEIDVLPDHSIYLRWPTQNERKLVFVCAIETRATHSLWVSSVPSSEFIFYFSCVSSFHVFESFWHGAEWIYLASARDNSVRCFEMSTRLKLMAYVDWKADKILINFFMKEM